MFVIDVFVVSFCEPVVPLNCLLRELEQRWSPFECLVDLWALFEVLVEWKVLAGACC